VVELVGSALAGFSVIYVVFQVLGYGWSFGMAACAFAAFLVVYGVLCRHLHGVLVMKDRLATTAIWTCAAATFVPLAAVIAFVVVRGAPVVLRGFPRFLYTDMSQLSLSGHPVVGVGAAIVGTVEQVGISTLITVPLGILTATYLVDSRGAFARLVTSVVDAMTGSPAIVAGVFVYLVWVAPHHTNGKSGFAAALALAVMMLPIVTRTAYEVIVVVPGVLREEALALGAPNWRVILRVVIPTARVGLVTAVILGIARIAGETAPILFAAGGNTHYNWNPLHGQQDSLPFLIYKLISQGAQSIVADAWGASFVLVLVVLGLFVVARLIGRHQPGRRVRFVPWARRAPLVGP
jgi:phosphate transport system permease protein